MAIINKSIAITIKQVTLFINPFAQDAFAEIKVRPG
jgi:hypothetical protein